MGLFSNKIKEIDNIVYAPTDGKLMDLSMVEDELFAKKIMGDGFAIEPVSNKFYSPISGIVETAFPTGHAFGIRRKDGVEVLIHIGIDTVSLKGKGFIANVKQGDKINANDLLVDVDLDFICKEGYPLTTMIIITSPTSFECVCTQDEVKSKDEILKIIK